MGHDKSKGDFQTVATKVSTWAYERLSRIAKRKGMTLYELLQMVCDTLIRYMDDAHNLSPDMERAMSIFEHMIGWKDSINLADPTISPEVCEAIYFLTADGKKGSRAVHVTKPFFGNWRENVNIQQILERAIELLMPERYRRLRALAVELDCNSLLDLIDHLIDYHTREQDAAALRREFEDADRSEYGRKPVSSAYKRHHRQDMDMFEARERRELEQRSEEAREWLEENMGFKPFCGEW